MKLFALQRIPTLGRNLEFGAVASDKLFAKLWLRDVSDEFYTLHLFYLGMVADGVR